MRSGSLITHASIRIARPALTWQSLYGPDVSDWRCMTSKPRRAHMALGPSRDWSEVHILILRHRRHRTWHSSTIQRKYATEMQRRGRLAVRPPGTRQETWTCIDVQVTKPSDLPGTGESGQKTKHLLNGPRVSAHALFPGPHIQRFGRSEATNEVSPSQTSLCRIPIWTSGNVLHYPDREIFVGLLFLRTFCGRGTDDDVKNMLTWDDASGGQEKV